MDENPREEYQERFKELGAEDVFRHLMLENQQKFDQAKMEYDGPADELLELIEEYNQKRRLYRENNTTWNDAIKADETEDVRTFLERIKDVLLDHNHFRAFQDNGEILRWNGVVYDEGGEPYIRKTVHTELKERVKKHEVDEVVEKIRRTQQIERPVSGNKPHLIPVANGVYNLETGELQEPDPQTFLRNQLPIAYDPDAECPQIKEFLHDVVREENVPVLQELVGYTMYRDYPRAKAFMLLGGGENGKSTFLNLVKQFLGEENIASPSLHSLVNNRFAKAELYGKLANINGDLSGSKLYQTGAFKELTGQDLISAERKHKGRFQFKNYATLIYAANQLPNTDDLSHAFFRRWAIVRFPYKFTANPDDGHKDKDPDVLDDITTDEELSGLFNWAVEGLQRVLADGFTTTSETEDVKREWLLEADPLKIFLDDHIEAEQGAAVPKDDVYRAYQEFCDEHGQESVVKQQFTKQLKRQVPAAGTGQSREVGDSGDRTRVYTNIKYIKVSQVSQGKSNLSRTHAHIRDSSNQPRDTCDTSVVDAVREIEAESDDSVAETAEVATSLDKDLDTTKELLDEAAGDGAVYEHQPGRWKTL